MTQNRETDSGQDEQGAIEQDLTGYTPEGKGPLAPTSAGFGKGNVPAWLRAHRLNNIGLGRVRSSSVITDAKQCVNLRSVDLRKQQGNK